MLWWLVGLLVLVALGAAASSKGWHTTPNRFRRRRACASRPSARIRSHRKPDWVRPALVRMAAEAPLAGCRTLASSFNRRYAETSLCVGKTFVADTLRQHRHNAYRRRGPFHPPAFVCPIRAIWALDITEHRLDPSRPQPIAGLLDHGSRALLSLEAVRDKSAITLLRLLLTAIERYGRPTALRTDNEPVFTSRLFQFGLRWLGIRHQRTALHSPWQNGRIERLFGTLKPMLRLFELADMAALHRVLAILQMAYNHDRPHQALDGLTPADAWRTFPKAAKCKQQRRR